MICFSSIPDLTKTGVGIVKINAKIKEIEDGKTT